MGTVYISPTGSGNKSGSDWANAAVITSLDAMIKKAGAGGTVLLQADAGAYKVTGPINIYGAGVAGSPVTIKGVAKSGADMDVQIEGTRPAVYAIGNPSGNELFKLQKGADNLTFENMSINNTGTAFRAAGDIKNLTIQDIDAHNVMRFFEDYAGGTNTTATISGLTIRDVNVEGFSKNAIRLRYDTHNVLIENVVGDSQKQDGDDFAMGVHLTGTVHDVVFRKVTMKNAVDTVGGTYWNADGFATERDVYNILFEDTVASGNTDAGYDLKSKSTVLLRAVAEDNKRNFRVWGDTTIVDSVGLNPHKFGGIGSQTQVWVASGGKAVIKGGQFDDAGTGTYVFHNEGGSITFTGGTEVTYASTAKLAAGSGIVGLNTLDVHTIAGLAYSSIGAFFPLLTAIDPLAAVAQPAPVPATTSPASPTTTTPVAEASDTQSPVVLAPAPVKIVSTAANETFVGTAAKEVISFNLAAKTGTDTIKSFGKDDVLVFSSALKDGNNDGIITFGKNGVLDLANGSKLVLPELKSGLRLLGKDQDGFVYGDASVRPKSAQESKLAVADKLSGEHADKLVNKFFFDTALQRQLGADNIIEFGKKDILVTTTKLGDGVAGSKISAEGGAFELEHGGHALGSVAISDTAGNAVSVLEFDGEHVTNGVHYFVYSLVDSSAGLAQLAA